MLALIIRDSLLRRSRRAIAPASALLMFCFALARDAAGAVPIPTPESFTVPHPVRPTVARSVDADGTGLLGLFTGDLAGGLQVWRRVSGTWTNLGVSHSYAYSTQRFVRSAGDAGSLDLMYSWLDVNQPSTHGSIGYLENNGTFGPDHPHATDGVGQVNGMFGPVFMTTAQGSGYKLLAASDMRNVPGATSQGGIFYLKLPLNVANTPLFEATPYVPNNITSADFNGDGVPDQAISSVEFLSNGDTQWHISTRLRTGATWGTWEDRPVGFSLGDDLYTVDVNGDGKPDLCYPYDNNFVVALNNGAGHFPVPVTVPGPAGSIERNILADLNGDGRPDLIRTGFESGFSSYGMWVSLNNGAGGFLAPTYYPFAVDYTIPDAGFSIECAVSDFNGDGKMDIAVSDFGENRVVLFFGDGSGSFIHPPVSISLSNDVAQTVAIGDLNGDGLRDLAVGLTSSSASVRLLISQGSGAFAASVGYDGGPTVTNAVVADMDGDGNPDVALGRGQDAPAYLSGYGNYFGPVVPLDDLGTGAPGPASATGIDAIDMNGDGAAELVCAVDRGTNGAFIELRTSDGSGGFLPFTEFALNGTSAGVALSDLHNNHTIDAIALTQEPGSDPGGINVLSGITNQANFGPLHSAVLPFTPPHHSPHGFALANLTGTPGTRDVITLDDSPALFVLHDPGTGTFSVSAGYLLPGEPTAVAVGDLDGDGRPDVAVTCPLINTVALYTGVVANGTATEYDYTVNSPVDVQIGDVTGDGKNDLVVLSSTPPSSIFSRAIPAGRRYSANAVRVTPARIQTTASSLIAFPAKGVPSATLAVPPRAGSADRLALAISPNPAHSAARLDFTLPIQGRARIEVFDVAGRRIARLFDGNLGAGPHQVSWDGREERGGSVRAGVYMAKLEIGGKSAVRRMVWMP